MDSCAEKVIYSRIPGQVEEEKHEANKSEKDPERYPSVSYFQLYKFATLSDKIMILVGIICSIICAAVTANYFTLYGQMASTLVSFQYSSHNTTSPQDEINQQYEDKRIYFGIHAGVSAVIIFVTSYISTYLFNVSALRQTSKMRQLFLQSLLNRDMSWYDTNTTGDFASKNSQDFFKIQDGLGEKVAVFIYSEVRSLYFIVLSFIFNWKLSLFSMSLFPFAVLSTYYVTRMSSKFSMYESKANGEANCVAQEALNSIKTVVTYEGEAEEHKRYELNVTRGMKFAIRRLYWNGLGNAFHAFLNFLFFVILCWYVSISISEIPTEKWTETIILVFIGSSFGFNLLSSGIPYIETFSMAAGSASKILYIIDQSSKEKKSVADKFVTLNLSNKGFISFNKVSFSYPTRTNVEVLKNLDIRIELGETVALVGSSGCGKSTCIQLLQRLYDPTNGSIEINGIDVKKSDLDWFRNQIGVVSQEPDLFEVTIFENIQFGRQDATKEDIHEAAKLANAHDFIMEFPKGYQTIVGEGGAQLSGGQKQRIAIARALVRKPSILLLDEATSSLDANNEAFLQDSLKKATQKCTTIIVTHRLSMLRDVDRIVVLANGKVEEQGRYKELVDAKGIFYKLNMQMMYTQNTESTNLNDTLKNDLNDSENDMLLPNDTEKSGVNLIQDISAKIFNFTLVDKVFIVFGILFNILDAICDTIASLFIGQLFGMFSSSDNSYIAAKLKEYSIYFFLIAVLLGIFRFLGTILLGTFGERFATGLKSQMFETMLKQNMDWFDKPEHGVGSLLTALSGCPLAIQGVFGLRTGVMFSLVTSIIVILTVGFILSWKLTAVMSLVIPITVTALYFEQRMTENEIEVYDRQLGKSTKLAAEALSNCRTVISLSLQEVIFKKYSAMLTTYKAYSQKNAHIRGFVYGIVRNFLIVTFTISLYYGSALLKKEYITTASILTITDSFMCLSECISYALGFSTNYQKAFSALRQVKALLQQSHPKSDGIDSVPSNSVDVSYEHVCYTYPTRPNFSVLTDINLKMSHAKTVALVGPSGCGKTTIIELLQRFRLASSGQIFYGSKDIRTIRSSSLRRLIGTVSQEPNLFSRTIGENIAYGDNTRKVEMDEILKVAKSASIHDFIVSLPLGYETRLGERGTQLSGGQKQRIAIARALIRNPDFLLLDEATSALDSEGEKVVQDALDEVRKGKTCIIVAHRLNTVRGADLIVVIDKGRIVEIGDHEKLYNLQNLYWQMCNVQS